MLPHQKPVHTSPLPHTPHMTGEIIESLYAIFCMVRAVHKFYFTLVNRRKNGYQCKGHVVIEIHVFDRICMSPHLPDRHRDC
jgi:hypothetical protein